MSTADNDASSHAQLDELRQLYATSPCGYLIQDGAGQVLRANPRAREWLGIVTEGARLGLADMLTARSRREFASAQEWFKSKGRVDGLDIEIAAAERRAARVLRMTAHAVREHGAVKTIYVALYDISELRQLKEELTTLTMEQAAMLNSDLLGIMRLRQRQIVWKNRTLERMLGYGHDELLGQSTRVLYPDDDTYNGIGNSAYPVVNDGGLWRTQVQMARKNGARLWVDMNGTLLSAAKDESVWLVQDITQLKQYQTQVEHYAFHDPLTGLPNRMLLSDRLRQAMQVAARTKSKLAVCYIDLDGFKPINDQRGHRAGDALLVTLSQRLQATVRAVDTASRVGGDEFVIVAGVDTPEAVEPLCERLLAALAAPVELDEGPALQVSASIGVALYPDHARRDNDLLRLADDAMYEAKRSGKNRFALSMKTAA